MLRKLINKLTSKKRALFICKKRHYSYGDDSKSLKSSGLINSVRFVVDMLNENGIDSIIADVVDGNEIDKYVTRYRPDFVFIEALWCPPYKLEQLAKIHKNVVWVVRIHSEIPFLANEGIAMEWLHEYTKTERVFLSANSYQASKDLDSIIGVPVLYLPNYYPITNHNKNHKSDHFLNIGCFGAIRPLKNQLYQAIAAINFADSLERPLKFHINTERIEGRGEPILKNIRYLFINNPRHTLVEHSWLEHEDFIRLVRRMDIGMQVSFSETFNIVSADFVNNNIPVVVSDEIAWVSQHVQAKPTDLHSIEKCLIKAYEHGYTEENKRGLCDYNDQSTHRWLCYLK